jgi:hypothetical protein
MTADPRRVFVTGTAQRNKALGIWGSTGAVGGTAACLIGGPVSSGLGWEWIFFINVPVAAGVIALSPVLLGESRARDATPRFDLAGALTITAALVALVYAVVQAPGTGWIAFRTLGLLALAALLGLAFARIESRSAAPLAPPAVFRSRALAGRGGVPPVAVAGLALTGLGAQQRLLPDRRRRRHGDPVHRGRLRRPRRARRRLPGGVRRGHRDRRARGARRGPAARPRPRRPLRRAAGHRLTDPTRGTTR